MGPAILGTVGLSFDLCGVILLAWGLLGLPRRGWIGLLRGGAKRLLGTGRTVARSGGPTWDDRNADPTGQEGDE
jgi:hypothetical protein